jgi:hypothetical protein
VVNSSFSTLKEMSKLLPVVLMGAGLSIAVSFPALASDEIYHGNFCAPSRQGDINRIQRSQFGVDNSSSTNTASVQCPFNLPFNAQLRVNSVWLTVYDRNSSLNVDCTLLGVGLDGNTVWSRSVSSSGSSASHQFLNFSPPSQFVATMNMTCSLPPSTNSGVSHITTYRVIATP